MKHNQAIYIIASAFALSLVLFCFPGRANMVVYPMEAEVSSHGISKIRVISKSDDVQFVNVTGKQILNPGTAQEKEVQVEETAKNALIVTPRKLALSAGSERIVRLVSMVPPAKETTWRIYFEGVKEEGPQAQAKADIGNKSTAQIGVNIVWGALIHVAPESIQPSLKYDTKTGLLINDGTIRLPLREIGTCESTGICSWQNETKTIYPDMVTQLSSFNATPDKHYRAKYYHWIKKSLEEIEISAL